jgi:hypothetical protein
VAGLLHLFAGHLRRHVITGRQTPLIRAHRGLTELFVPTPRDIEEWIIEAAQVAGNIAGFGFALGGGRFAFVGRWNVAHRFAALSLRINELWRISEPEKWISIAALAQRFSDNRFHSASHVVGLS